jgi:hypothetical protein
MRHSSLLCNLRHSEPHRPCSGTCDGHGSGTPCDEPCECWCHSPAGERLSQREQHARWLQEYERRQAREDAIDDEHLR